MPAHGTRVSRGAGASKPPHFGGRADAVQTFKNDTERALADLLAYTIVDADDVGGGGRGVGVRGHGDSGEEEGEARGPTSRH